MSIEPVRKHVIVEATPERAFRIFTENTKWWPRDHHIGKGALDDRGHSPQLGRFRGVVGNHAAVKRKTHLSLRAERGIPRVRATVLLARGIPRRLRRSE